MVNNNDNECVDNSKNINITDIFCEIIYSSFESVEKYLNYITLINIINCFVYLIMIILLLIKLVFYVIGKILYWIGTFFLVLSCILNSNNKVSDLISTSTNSKHIDTVSNKIERYINPYIYFFKNKYNETITTYQKQNVS